MGIREVVSHAKAGVASAGLKQRTVARGEVAARRVEVEALAGSVGVGVEASLIAVRDDRHIRAVGCERSRSGPSQQESRQGRVEVWAGLDGPAHNSADYLHLLMEVIKCVFSAREYTYGDPRFIDVPLDAMMGRAHITERLKQIDPQKAMPDMPPPIMGNPKDFPSSQGSPQRDPDTSYLCVVDRWGNAFSATPSDASWRSAVIPGLGIVPSARGCQSRPDPGHPSGVAPGKRPRLTPNPAIVVRDDGAVMPFGAPGGDSQVQSMLQVFLNIFHFNMDIQEAIDAPRMRSLSFPSSFAPFPHYPGLAGAEARIPGSVLRELERRGHKLEIYPDYTRLVASVEVILAEPDAGFLRAGADPRQPAYAIVR